MLSRKHFQSGNFKQNSSSAKHEECTQTRPSLTSSSSSGEAFLDGRSSHSQRRCCRHAANSATCINGTSSRRSWSWRGTTNNGIVTALCVAFAIATLVAQNCDATSTDSQNINGTSDIRSIRDGISVAAADASTNDTTSTTINNNSNSRTRDSLSGAATEPKQSLSPSLNSNLVAANFSNVAPILSSNDIPGHDSKSVPSYFLELMAAGGEDVYGEDEALEKEKALYVQQLEMNFAKLKRRVPIYQNEFAVHIPSGAEVADRIAHKYGFENMGQIGSLKGYYLFHHRHVSKRSLDTSPVHHEALTAEEEVRWMQQQHERVRKKRDYATLGIGGYPSHRASLLRNVAPNSRIEYRDTQAHSFFPDPLFKEQWYLNGGAKDGLDMNIGPAWQKGYTGKGVVVSILDDGIQTNHPDLAQNYDPQASYDINGNDSDPMPQDNGDNKHGTRCAGEVAAVAFNSFCGVGVAYNASIGGVRMLDGSVNDAVEAKALGLNPNHIDIYSASWGPEDDGMTVDGPGPLARRAFIYGVTSGRQGKGSIYIWASGNGGRLTDSCNCDGYTNSIFTLSISSATQAGYKPWYLEECSSTLATTYSSGTPGHDKSVATVDMDGQLRPDRICTVEHTGTSASAPLAAGICALALEANPALTWRDMQYLVIFTSRPEPLEKEAGWILNGVKKKISHKFGYGLMDAGAMVSLAEQWTNVPVQHICKSREITENHEIEGTYGYTLQTHMDVNGCAGSPNEVRFLEHVQCKITLRFFPRGNLRILLTSPMGTTSTLLFERPRDISKSNFDDWPFLSVHFWGEKAEGRWTLQVINSGRRRVNQAGILHKWQLIFYGTQTNPIRLKSDLSSGGGQSVPTGGLARLNANPFVFPTETNINGGGGGGGIAAGGAGSYYQPPSDLYSGYANYQNLFAGAASTNEKVYATFMDASSHNVNIPTPQRENVMADANNKNVLHDCDPECDQQGCYGKGPTQCVACKHYRLDNTCVSRCPPRSFPNQGGVCWPCHESCETCAGAGQDSCLTCAPAHFHVTDLAVCLQVCPDGYYENYDNKTCVPCEANCASCQDRPDYCTSCEHHLVMHENKCYSACPEHTYETEDYNCATCHPSCRTCNGSSETQCITCKSGRFSHEGKCLNICPAGYYSDKKRQECMACPKGCGACTQNGLCSTCLSGWIKNKKGRCIAKGSDNCDESEYSDSGHCRPCHSTCETCTGSTESDCLSCSASFLLQHNKCVTSCDDGYYMETGGCAKCLHTCTQCVSRMNCTQCAKGLLLQSGECRTTCADGYYSDRGNCEKCYLSCHTCSGPRRDQCVKCPKGWQLAGGECHPECPEGYYKTPYGCQKCHHYCKTCQGAGPLACTTCPAHFMLEDGLCIECLGSQYYEPPTQTCKTCHESCRTCSGSGQYSCVTCAYPLHLDRLNNQCVPCCSSNAHPDDQSCCHCDKDTGGCINASPAGKRRIATGSEPQVSSLGEIKEDGDLEAAAAASSSIVAHSILGGGGVVVGGHGGNTGGGGSSAFLMQFSSPFAAITALAVAACLLIMLVFVTIFAVLQRGSSHRRRMPPYTGIKYNKLSQQQQLQQQQQQQQQRGRGATGRRGQMSLDGAETSAVDGDEYDREEDSEINWLDNGDECDDVDGGGCDADEDYDGNCVDEESNNDEYGFDLKSTGSAPLLGHGHRSEQRQPQQQQQQQQRQKPRQPGSGNQKGIKLNSNYREDAEIDTFNRRGGIGRPRSSIGSSSSSSVLGDKNNNGRDWETVRNNNCFGMGRMESASAETVNGEVTTTTMSCSGNSSSTSRSGCAESSHSGNRNCYNDDGANSSRGERRTTLGGVVVSAAAAEDELETVVLRLTSTSSKDAATTRDDATLATTCVT